MRTSSVRRRSFGLRRAVLIVFAVTLLGGLGAWPAAAQEIWYPVPVNVWEPPFNADRTRRPEEYRPLEAARERWRICVLIPHLKDAYWLAVNYAVLDEARRMGVSFAVYSAGGYEYLDRQREQFDECLGESPDGILLSAVSLDGLNDLVAVAAGQGVPVVDLINGVSAAEISARVGVDFWDMGAATGRYLAERPGAYGRSVQVAWLPGPAGAGWVEAADAGFRAAIDESDIAIVEALNGDTGRAAQRALMEEALDRHPGAIDYVAGTAVTAEAGVGALRDRGLADEIGLLAFYYSPGVHRAIKRGQVLAAPSDLPALQTRIAMDTLVRIIQGDDYFPHVAASVVMVDRERLKQWDASSSLPPRGFRPVFNLAWH
ncbi:MAG: TMAO reductase system periplasmic protein TorT [Rhodospirillales bacterium]|nr:TMAO reductase system periplasmic protein TorT [Rhodospirillales bacterium]